MLLDQPLAQQYKIYHQQAATLHNTNAQAPMNAKHRQNKYVPGLTFCIKSQYEYLLTLVFSIHFQVRCTVLAATVSK